MVFDAAKLHETAVAGRSRVVGVRSNGGVVRVIAFAMCARDPGAVAVVVPGRGCLIDRTRMPLSVGVVPTGRTSIRNPDTAAVIVAARFALHPVAVAGI